MGNILIEESGISHERILADLYSTSVGHVTAVSRKDHKYSVNDFGKKIDVVVYSKEDVSRFTNSLLPILIKDTKSQTIDIHKLDIGLKSGKEVKCGISFQLDKVASDEILKSYLSKVLTEDKLLEIIRSFINDYEILKSHKGYVYKQDYKGYHIWELISNPTKFQKG